jgi:catechol 2,3-dioxygenase-like lactoylglutathione lyase family enzyme
MRIQLALNVSDLDKAVEYYSRVFGTTPHKRRPGYVNFAIDEPPLKLVLFENPGAKERLNHLGVEVFDRRALDKASERVRQSRLAATERGVEDCCHATQDKIWSVAPDGEQWEWYQILDDEPERTRQGCCA